MVTGSQSRWHWVNAPVDVPAPRNRRYDSLPVRPFNPVTKPDAAPELPEIDQLPLLSLQVLLALQKLVDAMQPRIADGNYEYNNGRLFRKGDHWKLSACPPAALSYKNDIKRIQAYRAAFNAAIKAAIGNDDDDDGTRTRGPNDPNSERNRIRTMNKLAEIDVDKIPLDHCLSIRLAGGGLWKWHILLLEQRVGNALKWLGRKGLKPHAYVGAIEEYEFGGWHQHMVIQFESAEAAQAAKRMLPGYWVRHGSGMTKKHCVHFRELNTMADLRGAFGYLALPKKDIPAEVKSRFRWSKTKFPEAPKLDDNIPAPVMPLVIDQFNVETTPQNANAPRLVTERIITDKSGEKLSLILNTILETFHHAPWLERLSEMPHCPLKVANGKQVLRTIILRDDIIPDIPPELMVRIGRQQPTVEIIQRGNMPHKRFTPGFLQITMR